MQRFHCHRLTHPEDVAQHTFNVMNLVLIMTNFEASRELLLRALTHDMGEYATGDIPAHTKLALDPVAQATLVADEMGALGAIYPQALSVCITVEEHCILNTADKLDGLLRCLTEIRMGNYSLKEVGDRYVQYIHEITRTHPLPPIARELIMEITTEYAEEVIKI